MDRKTLTRSLKALATRDPVLAAALATIGPPPERTRPPGFATLVRIIVGQQVSSKAAASLWARLEAAIDPVTPERLAMLSPEDLRALGLSRQKAAYALGLAEAVASGALDLARVHAADDEAAIAELITVKGIGRWSAEIYLLFALGRPDVFPSGDLALAIAAQRLKKLRRRPDPKRLAKLAEAWRPHRGAAAHFLWHYYANPPV
jgi:DNA-3-methyladenine glycosylase II